MTSLWRDPYAHVDDRVADLVGADRLLIGTVEWGATNLGPGHLSQTTQAPFVIGEPDGSESERVSRLAEVLGTVTEAHISRNIRGQVWSKLLINSTWSGLGAASGLVGLLISYHHSTAAGATMALCTVVVFFAALVIRSTVLLVQRRRRPSW